MLKFEYLLKLNVVCVGIEESQDGLEKNILCNLFPDDAGLEPPHQVHIYTLRSNFIPTDYFLETIRTHFLLLACYSVYQAHSW